MNKSDNQLKKAIDGLNLDPIKFKIMDEEEGLGWTANQVDEVEKFYRRFLFLSAKYPEKSLVPSKHIDAFWHQHILDTQKYYVDSITIFGKFFHHFPYFGKRGEDDRQNWRNAISETNDLYIQHFKESTDKLTTSFKLSNNSNSRYSSCDSSCNASCNSSCSKKPPSCTTSCSSSCGGKSDIIMSQLRPSLPKQSLNTLHNWY
jgi:hypothetical protein